MFLLVPVGKEVSGQANKEEFEYRLVVYALLAEHATSPCSDWKLSCDCPLKFIQ